MSKPVLKITSRKNQIVKDTAALLSSSEKRNQTGTFLIEGARLVQDAVRSGVSISKLFFTASASKKYEEYIVGAMNIAAEIFELDDHVADMLSSTKNSQGVFALCEFGQNLLSQRPVGRLIVLENIQDPSNMGNILRTAEALGIDSIMLCGDCCDLTAPKVLRGSMGAVFRLNFIRAHAPKDAEKMLAEFGYEVFGAVPSCDALKITDIHFDSHKTVAIGNEGNGLSGDFLQICSKLVTIPMLGRAESLNAATAAAIIMWETTKS